MDCMYINLSSFVYRVSLAHVVHLAGMERMENLVNPETLEISDLLETLYVVSKYFHAKVAARLAEFPIIICYCNLFRDLKDHRDHLVRLGHLDHL